MQFLDGYRVLDATQIISGPWASLQLGDLGAEILKIERPEIGDLIREVPPHVDGESSQFAAINRNKESVALDLTTEEGQQIFREFAVDADVVIENFKPGLPERFGIDYASIREVNEELIYCSIKGFDTGSRYEGEPSFDMAVQAMGGLMSITGPGDGPPTYIGIPVGDIAPAMYASQSVIAALFDREVNDSSGEHIEISMMNATVALLGIRLSASAADGESYPRTGNMHKNIAPYKVFETADGHLVVAIVGDNLWPAFCKALDRDELITDERFATQDVRAEHRDELYGEIDPEFAARSTSELFGAMQEHGVPAGPVNNTQEVIEDPYVNEQQLLQELSTTGMDGSVLAPRYPANFLHQDPLTSTDPPAIGEHTVPALRDLGYSDAEIETFLDEGIVESPD